jgi:hypothetical protein
MTPVASWAAFWRITSVAGAMATRGSGQLDLFAEPPVSDGYLRIAAGRGALASLSEWMRLPRAGSRGPLAARKGRDPTLGDQGSPSDFLSITFSATGMLAGAG